MTDITWLLLTCKVPAEPSARRIAIWRKPIGKGPVHLRRLKMIEADIAEAGDVTVLLQTVALDAAQEARMRPKGCAAALDDHARRV